MGLFGEFDSDGSGWLDRAELEAGVAFMEAANRKQSQEGSGNWGTLEEARAARRIERLLQEPT